MKQYLMMVVSFAPTHREGGQRYFVPLCLAAGDFNAFYSVEDRNIRNLVSWLWNTL